MQFNEVHKDRHEQNGPPQRNNGSFVLFPSIFFSRKLEMITLTANTQTSLSRIMQYRYLLDQKMTILKEMHQPPSPTVALASFIDYIQHYIIALCLFFLSFLS